MNFIDVISLPQVDGEIILIVVKRLIQSNIIKNKREKYEWKFSKGEIRKEKS